MRHLCTNQYSNWNFFRNVKTDKNKNADEINRLRFFNPDFCYISLITSIKHKVCCIIRISKILLYAIHNRASYISLISFVVLSGFQRYFCMQYTTSSACIARRSWLYYQDFKDTFVCNTQPAALLILLLWVVLSGFQRYFCMQYTTVGLRHSPPIGLYYQDFKDTFVCNTQLIHVNGFSCNSCIIRISMNNLKDIHNVLHSRKRL